jgi:hypothetical protein
VLRLNKKKLMILNCLPFLWTPCKNVIQMFGIFKNCNYEHFGVKLVILHNPFFISFLWISKKGQYTMLGGALLNLCASTITLNTEHVQRRSMQSTLHLLLQQWNGTPHDLCGFVPSCGLRGFSIVFPSGYCLWLTNWVILVLLTLVPRLVWQLGAQWLIVFVN